MRRVCGLDVHKDSVFCAIVDETGVIFQCKFGVLTDELENMLSVLKEYQVQEVAMESTCVYWMPIWRVIEPYFPQKLVNPYFIKQLPGRKSDVKDAEWIATCLHKGLIRGSYVPNEHIQQLRQYDRRIFDLTAEISRKLTKLDMALQRCNIRLSNYVSSVDVKSYQDVVQLLCSGITDPEQLINKIHGKTITKWGRETILASLSGVITDVDIEIISQLHEEILLARQHKDLCQQKMQEFCELYFPQEYANIKTIPGVKERSATSIIAEVGTDMSNFQSAAHLVSWCGLRPRNEESAGKIKGRKITHGNKYLRRTLVECAWAASKKQNTHFNKFSYIQCVVRRKTNMKVQVAIARKILVAIWHILHNNTPYREYLIL